jgi:alanyl-tRNA synthetase
MVDENKELHRRVRVLEEIAARVEADELFGNARPDPEGVKIIAQVVDNRDSESLKRLALAVISHPRTIVLLGSRDNDAARLVFARSADSPGDMNAFMRDACAMLDGRGGGKADLAQGGGKNAESLERVLEATSQSLIGMMGTQQNR